MWENLSRRRFLGSSTAAVAASGIASGIARAASGVTEIKALLITGGPLYPKYWEALTATSRSKTGITVTYDLLQFMPMTARRWSRSAPHAARSMTCLARTPRRSARFQLLRAAEQVFLRLGAGGLLPGGDEVFNRSEDRSNCAAIPRNVDARIQYYRTDAYDAHNLQPAVTWDDLVSVSQALTGDGHYGLVVPGQGDPAQRTFSDYFWQAGGDWVDDKNKPAFNSAEGIQALTFYRDLIQKYKVMPPDAVNYGWNENTSEFASGAVYDTFNWPSHLRDPSNPATSKVVGKWATAPYVKNKTAISCAVSHAMALNSLSKKKDAALEFIKYVVSADAQMLAFQQFTYFPSRAIGRQKVIAIRAGRKGSLARAVADDDRERQGMAEAARLLQGVHDDVDGDREGVEQPDVAGRLAQPDGERSAGGDEQAGAYR